MARSLLCLQDAWVLALETEVSWIFKLREAHRAIMGCPGSRAQLVELVRIACKVEQPEAEALFEEVMRRHAAAHPPDAQPKG